MMNLEGLPINGYDDCTFGGFHNSLLTYNSMIIQ